MKNIFLFFILIPSLLFGQIGLTNRTEKLYLSGNLGIGTTSALTPLHVFGISYFNGNVGIGTSAPAHKLYVVGNGFVSGTLGVGVQPIASISIYAATYDGSINTVRIGKGGGGIISNTTVGAGSLVNNTTGLSNTSVGYNSLYTNQYGWGNTSMGSYSLFQNNGKCNTAFGDSAMLWTVSTNYNTAVGRYAGLSNIGSRNVFLGNEAGSGNTTGDDNVYLGYQAGALNTTGSGQLWIANTSAKTLIWGDFASNYVNVNGNLGIGTAAPTQKLDVVGKVRISNMASSNLVLLKPTSLGVIDTIETIELTTALGNTYFQRSGDTAQWIRVEDSARFLGNINFWNKYNLTDANTFFLSRKDSTNFATIFDYGYFMDSLQIRKHPLETYMAHSRPKGLFEVRLDKVGFDSSMVFNGAGNLGIGTSAPAHKLDVVGDIYEDAAKVCRWRGKVGSPPSSPKFGDMYLNSGDNKIYVYTDDAAWVALN